MPKRRREILQPARIGPKAIDLPVADSLRDFSLRVITLSCSGEASRIDRCLREELFEQWGVRVRCEDRRCR